MVTRNSCSHRSPPLIYLLSLSLSLPLGLDLSLSRAPAPPHILVLQSILPCGLIMVCVRRAGAVLFSVISGGFV